MDKLDTSAAAVMDVIESIIGLDPVTGKVADLLEALSAELTSLLAERERDHANINLKADFIAATLDDLAQMEAERDALQKAQTYRYIGKDGKSILARDLEDQRDAFRAVLVGAEYCNIDEIGAYSLEDAMLLGVMAKGATQSIIAERDAALARVDVLEVFATYVAGTNTDNVLVALAGNPVICDEIIEKARAALAKGETL